MSLNLIFCILVIIFYYCRFYLFCTTISSKLHQPPSRLVSLYHTLSLEMYMHILYNMFKRTDHIDIFMSLKCVVYYANIVVGIIGVLRGGPRGPCPPPPP